MIKVNKDLVEIEGNSITVDCEIMVFIDCLNHAFEYGDIQADSLIAMSPKVINDLIKHLKKGAETYAKNVGGKSEN